MTFSFCAGHLHFASSALLSTLPRSAPSQAELCGCIPGVPSPPAPSWMQPTGGTGWRPEAGGWRGRRPGYSPALSLACAPRRSSGSCRAVLSSPPQVCSHGAPSCYSGWGGGLRQPLLILLQTVSLLVCLDFPSERACLCFLLAPD